MTPFLLFLLPTLALAIMQVSISGDFFVEDSLPKITAQVYGEDKAVITDRERETFRISDRSLKMCVEKYFGGYPDDVYVRMGTPWGDLYTTYGWEQIRRTIKPIRATVIEVDTKRQLISNKEFINKNSTPLKATLKLDKTFEDRVTTSWTKGGEFTVGAEVSIGVGVAIAEVGASINFETSRTWGEGYEHSAATTIMDGSELEFEVPPNSRVYGKTELSKSLVKMKVEYEASLDRDTAVNYARPHKGHHFHKFNINDVMRSCGLPLTVTSTEVITLDMITGVKLEIMNKPVSLFRAAIPLEEVPV